MTSLTQNRLLWKDCRELLPLFLAGCLAFVITVAATCLSWSGTEEFKSLGPIVKLISPLNLFVNVCGLVAGVLLFAPEKENRTSQFLGNLPMAPRSIATTKLWFGMASVVLFVAFCYLSVGVVGMIFGNALRGWPPRQEIIGNLFVPVMCFVWGVFWSLMLRSTLFTLVAAAASVLIAELFANFFVPELYGLPSSSSANSVVTWVVRIPVLAVLILLVFRALPDWLQDEPVKTFRISWPKISRIRRPLSLNESPRGVTASLVWQSFRQSKAMLIVGTIVCGMIAVGGLYQIPPQEFAILAVIAYAIPLFASGLAFAPDQNQNRYRFFQQQAEFGRKLWLSRLLPSAGLVMLATVCLTFGFDALSVVQSSPYYSFFDPMKVFLILLTGMSIGQFFSMLVSSPILSVVCAILYGTVGIAWAFLMLVCDASLWLFLLPAALILFLTTWVQAPRWLADKKTAFDRWFPWLSLIFAAILVMSGFAVKRSTEVAKSSSTGVVIRDSYTAFYDEITGAQPITMPRDPAVTELLEPSKELLEALAAFIKPKAPADRLFDPSLFHSGYQVTEWISELDAATLAQIVESNAKSIALIHEALRPANGYFVLNPRSEAERLKELQILQVLLLCEAEYWLRRDDTEKVLNSTFALFEVNQAMPVRRWGRRRPMSFPWFYRWSELPGQSSQRIKATIRELERRMKLSRGQSAAMELTFRHLGFQNQLDLAVSKDVLQASPQYVDPIVHRLLRWMPWEFERAKRVGEQLIEYTGQRDMIIDALLANPRRYFGASIYARTPALEDSPYLRYARTSPVVPWVEIEPRYSLRGQLADVQLFRYTKIRMALAAWRLDHDGYPANLQDLAPDYLNVVPCDVFDGGDFCYSATGLDHPVVWDASDTQSVMADYLQVGDKSKLERNLSLSERTPAFDPDDVIPANTPFLLPWSSAGGQSTTMVNLTKVDDNGYAVEESKIVCFDLSHSQGAAGRGGLFFDVEFELPNLGK